MEQQQVSIEQLLSMRITRVENAEKELAAAKIDLYSTNNQVVVQMVNNETKQDKAKIEELESELKSKGKEQSK